MEKPSISAVILFAARVEMIWFPWMLIFSCNKT